MKRYKVEFEAEGELRSTKDNKWKYIVGVGYDQWIPADATVTEIKPPFVPGYYRVRGNPMGSVFWSSAPPISLDEGKAWQDYYVRVRVVEPEEDR